MTATLISATLELDVLDVLSADGGVLAVGTVVARTPAPALSVRRTVDYLVTEGRLKRERYEAFGLSVTDVRLTPAGRRRRVALRQQQAAVPTTQHRAEL